MATTSIGIVYFEEDPQKIAQRIIYPSSDDREITDAVCPCGCGGKLWRSHLDPGKTPQLKIIDKADKAELSQWTWQPPNFIPESGDGQ